MKKAFQTTHKDAATESQLPEGSRTTNPCCNEANSTGSKQNEPFSPNQHAARMALREQRIIKEEEKRKKRKKWKKDTEEVHEGLLEACGSVKFSIPEECREETEAYLKKLEERGKLEKEKEEAEKRDDSGERKEAAPSKPKDNDKDLSASELTEDKKESPEKANGNGRSEEGQESLLHANGKNQISPPEGWKEEESEFDLAIEKWKEEVKAYPFPKGLMWDSAAYLKELEERGKLEKEKEEAEKPGNGGEWKEAAPSKPKDNDKDLSASELTEDKKESPEKADGNDRSEKTFVQKRALKSTTDDPGSADEKIANADKVFKGARKETTPAKTTDRRSYTSKSAKEKYSRRLKGRNGLSFIPAGADIAKFRNKGIHYRYLGDGEINAYDDNGQFFRTGNLLLSSEKPPSDEDWNYINTDIFDPACFLQSECMPSALGSAYYLLKVSNMLREALRSVGLEYYVDSGAYQAFNVDDKHIELSILAELYMKCADLAFVLDFIPSGDDYYDKDKMRFLATAQKYATDALKKYLGDHPVRLINIIHANCYQSQKLWLDTVFDPDIRKYACGFNRAFDFRLNLPIIAHLFYNIGAESIHLLGKSSYSFIPIFCLIGKYGPVTADGSSLLVNSFKNRIFLSLTPQGKLIDTPVGNRFPSHIPRHSPMSSACACPACREIPLYDVYKAPDKFNTQALLGFHNSWTFKSFVSQWNELARTLSIEEYVEAYEEAFGGRSKKNKERVELAFYVDNFLSLARDKGVDHAMEVYRETLDDCRPDEYRHIPLFYDDSVGNDLSPDESDGSSIYKAAKYLPESVIRELGFSPELLGKTPTTMKPGIADEIRERLEELEAILEDNESLNRHFGNDVSALWKELRKVVVEKRYRCLVDPSHKPKIKRAGNSTRISCSACGYKIQI